MVKSSEPNVDMTLHRIAGDRIVVNCRKPGKWETFRMSEQHHGFTAVARMNAEAILERGYKNVRS